MSPAAVHLPENVQHMIWRAYWKCYVLPLLPDAMVYLASKRRIRLLIAEREEDLKQHYNRAGPPPPPEKPPSLPRGGSPARETFEKLCEALQTARGDAQDSLMPIMARRRAERARQARQDYEVYPGSGVAALLSAWQSSCGNNCWLAPF